MTPGAALSMFLVMGVLSLAPDPSSAVVFDQTLRHGRRRGLHAALGIVLADALFIAVVFSGLAAVAAVTPQRLRTLSFVGGAVLVLLGLAMFRPARRPVSVRGAGSASAAGAGFAVTLADPKALLFYFGFLQIFVDLSAPTAIDFAVVVLLAAAAILSAKSVYVWLGSRASGGVAGRGLPAMLERAPAAIVLLGGLWLLSASAGGP